MSHRNEAQQHFLLLIIVPSLISPIGQLREHTLQPRTRESNGQQLGRRGLLMLRHGVCRRCYCPSSILANQMSRAAATTRPRDTRRLPKLRHVLEGRGHWQQTAVQGHFRFLSNTCDSRRPMSRCLDVAPWNRTLASRPRSNGIILAAFFCTCGPPLQSSSSHLRTSHTRTQHPHPPHLFYPTHT